MQTTVCTVCRDDDEMRTGLRGHITALMPQEIILPRKGLTATTSRVLRASLRNPRQHQLTPGDRFWDAERTLQEIKEAAYFNPAAKAEQACLPQALQVSVPSWWWHPLHTAMYAPCLFSGTVELFLPSLFGLSFPDSCIRVYQCCACALHSAESFGNGFLLGSFHVGC